MVSSAPGSRLVRASRKRTTSSGRRRPLRWAASTSSCRLSASARGRDSVAGRGAQPRAEIGKGEVHVERRTIRRHHQPPACRGHLVVEAEQGEFAIALPKPARHVVYGYRVELPAGVQRGGRGGHLSSGNIGRVRVSAHRPQQMRLADAGRAEQPEAVKALVAPLQPIDQLGIGARCEALEGAALGGWEGQCRLRAQGAGTPSPSTAARRRARKSRCARRLQTIT